MNSVRQLIILGSGPAGLTAAIYAARARLDPLVLAGVTYGGQLMTTTTVENFPGFPNGIEGPVLMQKMLKQAEKFGANIVYEPVKQVDFSQRPFSLKTNENKYQAQSVVIATGASPRKLGLFSEETFWGKGVSTCATCDGALYKDKIVAVIGGGDSAMVEASFLTRFAQKVYIVHRRDQFRASQIMQEKVLKNPKIEIIYNSEVKDIFGNQFVAQLKLLNNQTKHERVLKIDGMFLAIGHEPETKFLEGQVELDEKGYVKVKNEVETCVPGVFVAGDISDPVYKQAVTAAGGGCKAAMLAEKYLAELKI